MIPQNCTRFSRISSDCTRVALLERSPVKRMGLDSLECKERQDRKRRGGVLDPMTWFAAFVETIHTPKMASLNG